MQCRVYIRAGHKYIFLLQATSNVGINVYSLRSRVPKRLPVVDVIAKRPAGSVSITIKDVCFC